MRSRLQIIWLGATLAYALVRIALADRYFAKYGLSVPAFAALELGSSALFGFASGRFIPAVVDRHRRHTFGWGAATLVGFGAPDLFAVITIRRIPHNLLVILVVIIVGSLTFSGYELSRRVRTARAAKSDD
jgi:hypothetical protein